jgi:hypothetical protein
MATLSISNGGRGYGDFKMGSQMFFSIYPDKCNFKCAVNYVIFGPNGDKVTGERRKLHNE